MEQTTKLKPKQKKKEIVLMLRYERQAKLKSIFKRHIGSDNPINKLNLFREVYGHENNYSELQIFYLWFKLKQDLNWLRKTTNYFVGCRNNKGVWQYFIIKDAFDLKCYTSILKANIKKCNYMIGRAHKAIEQKFYKNLD